MLSNTPTISFSDAEALFKLSNMDSIQLIVAILNGELAYQLEELEGAPFFQGCRVDKIALLQLIEKCFPDSFSSILTKNKIQQYCSIGEKQFQYFKSLFSTELVIPHNGMSYIQPEALSKFFKTTLFLNRWCKLNELNVENTLASLSNEGIKPIFYSDKDLKIYFYKKTEVLEKFLWSLIK